VGQSLLVRNSDALLHNVHDLSALGNGFNVGEPTAGVLQTFRPAKEEIMLHITCDVAQLDDQLYRHRQPSLLRGDGWRRDVRDCQRSCRVRTRFRLASHRRGSPGLRDAIFHAE
jgi:hypothetical protein